MQAFPIPLPMFSRAGASRHPLSPGLPEGEPDTVVCATALANDAILVAIDGDMKQLARRFGQSVKSERFKRLSVIRLCCNEVLAKRLGQARKKWRADCGSILARISFGRTDSCTSLHVPSGMLRRPSANPVYSGIVAMFFACDGRFLMCSESGVIRPSSGATVTGLQYATNRRPPDLKGLRDLRRPRALATSSPSPGPRQSRPAVL
jgi:predicted nuclease of predicted toxin-antitoxin system